MLRRIRERFTRDMIRPVIYQTFTRFGVTLTAILVWDRLANSGAVPLPLSYGCMAAVIVYVLLAWMSSLRLDGVKAPVFDRSLFRFNRKKKNMDKFFQMTDIADYVDEEPVSFDELENDEKDICLLISNAVTSVLFIALSFLIDLF